VWVLKRDDLIGVAGGGVAFFMGDDVCAVWCREEGGGDKRVVAINALGVYEE